MAQLMLSHDLKPQPWLRDALQQNIELIETSLPKGSPLTVHLKRISKHMFGADLRSRWLGRVLVVSGRDSNILQALTRAHKHLVRQVGDLRSERNDRKRHRHPRRRGTRTQFIDVVSEG